MRFDPFVAIDMLLVLGKCMPVVALLPAILGAPADPAGTVNWPVVAPPALSNGANPILATAAPEASFVPTRAADALTSAFTMAR